MSHNAAGFDFSKFVPGFEFLKQMAQPRAMASPAAQWVAPTVDPEEVERRIQELKTVLFWLEQNTTALKATIQALEVQKLTLSTLQHMNVGLTDMAQVLQQAAATTMAGVTQAVGAGTASQGGAPNSDNAAPLSENRDTANGPDATEPASVPPRTTWFGAPAPASPAAAATTASTLPSAPEPEATAEPLDGPQQEAAASDQATSALAEDSALNHAFTQAGQWWGSMLQTFQTIAQQAQSDVLERQEAFAKTQASPAETPTTKATKAKGAASSASAKATPKTQPRASRQGRAAAGSARANATVKAAAKPAGQSAKRTGANAKARAGTAAPKPANTKSPVRTTTPHKTSR